tara:strand:+ start:1283 stop:2869 length:1587 start_codon:yes stop_codon:yes gene_type:complete
MSTTDLKRPLVGIVLVLALITAACGGNNEDLTEEASSASSSPSNVNDGDSGNEDNVEGGGVVGDSGGESADAVAEDLDLPECPVSAHLEVDGTVEIDFWHPFVAETEVAMQQLASRFNESQDKIVVTAQAQGSYGELLTKYRESIAFDDLPAVAIVDSQAFRDMVESESVLPAQSCVEADEFDLAGIDASLRGEFSIDGALYPAGLLVSAPVLYYNRTAFEAAGLDPDSPPETLAELREAAQTLKDAGVASEPLSFRLDSWFVDTWLTGAGVPVVNADNGRIGNATEANLLAPEAFDLYALLQQMNQAGLMAAFSSTPGQFEQYFAFLDPSRVAMLIETSTAATSVAGALGGTTDLSTLVEGTTAEGQVEGAAELNLDIDVAPLPGLRGPGQVFVSGGGFYMTQSGTAAEQSAAWEFMKFVNALEQQKLIHLKGSYLPVFDTVANDDEVRQVWSADTAGQWLATAYGQLENIDPNLPGPAIGPFSEYGDIIDYSLDELILSGVAPEIVLADAQDAVTAALQAYNEADF